MEKIVAGCAIIGMLVILSVMVTGCTKPTYQWCMEHTSERDRTVVNCEKYLEK